SLTRLAPRRPRIQHPEGQPAVREAARGNPAEMTLAPGRASALARARILHHLVSPRPDASAQVLQRPAGCRLSRSQTSLASEIHESLEVAPVYRSRWVDGSDPHERCQEWERAG